MTAIRITSEHKTILDFSDGKVSKNHIMNKLKTADFLEFKYSDKGLRTYLNYDIKVGIYTIFVDLFHTQSCARKLKDYDRFNIRILEGNKEIDACEDSNPSRLADAIVLCSKKNVLKAFL